MGAGRDGSYTVSLSLAYGSFGATIPRYGTGGFTRIGSDLMNESRFLTRHTGLMAISLSALLLAGCSTWNELMGKEESVDYKSTVRGDPLSVPPDLTQVSSSTRYRAPEGVATFSQYATEQERRSGRRPGSGRVGRL